VNNVRKTHPTSTQTKMSVYWTKRKQTKIPLNVN